MAFYNDNSLFLVFSLLFLAFIPYFHLIFIFFIMDIGEFFDKFFQKFTNLLLTIYDFILYVISNPIILIGLLIYLCMSIA